jgi:flagellar hook-associated protein 1 FlgK
VSITSILSVARTGLAAHQAAMETVSHNIANAETPGYSRQRVALTTNFPQQFSYGSVGTGVRISNIERVRDTLLDATYRREAGGASFHAASHDLLSSVEGILGEPSEIGLAASMDALWSSWSDLAADPTSSAARSVVRQRGAYVAGLLNRFDQQLTDTQQQNEVRLETSLDQFNTLAAEVAQLNGSIVSAEVTGKPASDLRDARDLRIDQMAKLGDTRVFERWDGSVQVLLGNVSIVDGIDSSKLEVVPTPPLRLRIEGASEALHEPIGGSVGAVATLLDRTVPELRGRLDALAQSLVTQVNGAHTQGYVFAAGSPSGVDAGDFFHPGDPDPAAPPALIPVTARTIRLSDAVTADAGKIAASGSATGASNNAVAKALAGFRTAPGMVSYTPPGAAAAVTSSFAEFYRATTTKLGSDVRDAESASLVHDTLAQQAEQRRQSVSGVSTDEELILLMRHQQAYAAASKLVSAADEMMQTLLNMV